MEQIFHADYDDVDDDNANHWNLFSLTDCLSSNTFPFIENVNGSAAAHAKPKVKKTVGDRWRTAFKKTKLLNDPWFEFHIDEYQAENVIRHRYDAIKQKWKQDKCVVKMETKPFANGKQIFDELVR
jgi:hypothetical protein